MNSTLELAVAVDDHARPVNDLRPSRRRPPGRDGVVAMAPLVLAFAPFALVIGSSVASLDDPVAGWAGSWLIFGGSAHLAAVHGLLDGAPVLAVLTGLLVQVRLLVYGASVAPRWREQPRWFRAVAPALLIDPTWALADRHDQPDRSLVEQRRFFLAAGLTLGVAWSAMIAAGAVIGDRLPDVGLDLAAPLCLLALVGVRLRERRHRWAAISAAVVALVTSGWAAGTGMVVAIGAGCVAAVVIGRSSS
jgi:predicted branched-subunit amino acid permease